MTQKNYTPEELAALNEIALLKAKTDFRDFLTLVFYELNPETKLHWNWHLDLICHTLCRTLPASSPINPTPDERLRKLIINVPPRSLKSVTVNVAWRAFVMGHYPHERVIAASYSGALSKKFNSDLTNIMRTSWYQQMFPNTQLAKQTEAKITTTKNGHSIATSTGGTVTGEGGNILIVDDLLNPEEAFSETERNNANRYFESTFYPSRLDNKTDGVCIIIMQRLHEDDVTGRLLEDNQDLPVDQQWFHVCLPAISEETKTYSFYNTSYTFMEGELLQPTRDTRPMLDALRLKKGSLVFAGQYQQRPAPADGGMINPNNFKPYTHLPPTEEILQIVQSWDTAIKASHRSDFSCCQTYAHTRKGHYLIDVLLAKLEYTQLRQAVIQQAERFQPNIILIEDKASGQQLLQELKIETSLPLKGITPIHDKTYRAAAVEPVVSGGSFYIPHDAHQQPWWQEFEKQITYFPNGKHDDVVDTMSQYIAFAQKPRARPRVRVL